MDVGLRVPLEAEVAREGVVVLPARLLLDVVRSLPAPQVSLELRAAEQDVELVSGNATFHIRTLRAEDFPPFPEPDPDSARLASRSEAFVSTALKVAGSASRDETRPVLTGILVSASDTELRMVATDSYRLSVKETTLETSLSSAFEVNVPARALQELARVAGARRGRGAAHQRPPEPGAVRARRRRPVLAADRRPVPELPPAAARDASSTSCGSPARS